MSETSWHDRREWEGRLQKGEGLTAQQTQLLIEDADTAERSLAILEGLKEALKSQLGILLIDATTDDDDDGEIRLEMIAAEDELSRATLKVRVPDQAEEAETEDDVLDAFTKDDSEEEGEEEDGKADEEADSTEEGGSDDGQDSDGDGKAGEEGEEGNRNR